MPEDGAPLAHGGPLDQGRSNRVAHRLARLVTAALDRLNVLVTAASGRGRSMGAGEGGSKSRAALGRLPTRRYQTVQSVRAAVSKRFNRSAQPLPNGSIGEPSFAN